MSSFEPEYFQREQQWLSDELNRLRHLHDIYNEQCQTLVLRWNDDAARNVNLQTLSPLQEDYEGLLMKSFGYSNLANEFSEQLQSLSQNIDQTYALFEQQTQQAIQTDDGCKHARTSQLAAQASSETCSNELDTANQQMKHANAHVDKLA
jgi:polyhydroxyalkanoate synthesis regulator protein